MVCDTMERAADLSLNGRLTPDRARQVLEAAIRDIFEATGETMPSSTIHGFFTSWIKEKEAECTEATAERYANVTKRFLKFLGKKADRPLTTLTPAIIRTFRNDLLEQVSPGTANTNLKILRAALSQAVKEEFIPKNPATVVNTIRQASGQKRRAFTVTELKRIVSEANEEWQTMILIGLYTGLRLRDIANLTWSNIDIENSELVVTTQKTDRTQILPIAQPLLTHFHSLPAGDDPTQPLCPSLYGKRSGYLSNQFHEILITAGLAAARTKKSTGTGRDKKRKLNSISFHALRHTATSLLKNAGVSDVVARDIIGHESVAVSAHYTHIDSETKRRAIDAMPDILE